MHAELEQLVAAALEESATPGCAVAVAHAGQTTTVCRGLANVETGVPFTAETRFPIASVTKTYTATAVMALVEAGRIDLDAPVQRYLPEFRVADADASDRVTIRHLLTHTAGWVGELRDEDPDSFDRGDGALAREVATLTSLPQVTPPGAAWSYSNAAIMVAGRVVEVMCGMTYEAAAEQLVLRPLGLSASTFFVERAIAFPTVVGHQATNDGFEVIRWPWAVERRIHAAGGIISTVGDQLRWARWWAGDAFDGSGSPLHPVTRDRMLDERVPAGNICDWMGLGWMLDELDGADVVHHGGTLFGLQSLVLFVPEARLSLVVLANARGGLLVQRRLRDYVLERWAGLQPRRHRPIELAPDRLGEYVGRYRRPAPGRDDAIEVRAHGSGLLLQLPGELDAEPPPPIEAHPFADDAIVVPHGPLEGFRGEFLRDGDGSVFALRFGGRICPRLADAPVSSALA